MNENGDGPGVPLDLRGRPLSENLIAIKGMLLLLCAVLGGLGWLATSEMAFARRAEQLDADVAAFRRLRWERPLLRGEPRDGNAAAAVFVELKQLKPLPAEVRQGLAEQVFYGQPLLPAQAKLVDARAPQLEALRTASQSTWSMTYLRPELGARMRAPDYRRAMDGALTLLAYGTTREADECLRVTADAVRMGQDLVPGAPLEATSLAMRITSVAAGAVKGCARRASPAGIRMAAREFRILAANPAPTGHGLELADLAAAMDLRRASTIPEDAGYLAIVSLLRARETLTHSWSYYENPHRFRELSPGTYPQALERWRKEDNWRRQSGLGDVIETSQNRTEWLFDDMRGQALLRGLAIALDALAEGHRRGGQMPPEPPALRQPELVDPFTGRSMLHQYDESSRELTIWSIGEDLLDGQAEETWSEKAPLDVIVRVTAPGAAEAPARRKRRKR